MLDVRDIDHLPVQIAAQAAPGAVTGARTFGATARAAPACNPRAGDRVYELAVESIHAYVPRAESRTALSRDRLEDRLHVRLRLADGAQDVGGGRLAIERLREVPVARLQLREQARVLDGDDRLIGERLEQRDLGPARTLPAPRRLTTMTPDGIACRGASAPRRRSGSPARPRRRRSSERQDGSVSTSTTCCTARVSTARPGGRLGGPAGRPEPLPARFGASRQAAPRRRQADQLAVVPDHGRRPRPEQPHRAVRDGLEDRLHVGLRLADGPEDLGGRRLPVQRFREVGVARLELREQARVLDGDHGLVGEGLEQRDLGRREPSWLGAGRRR